MDRLINEQEVLDAISRIGLLKSDTKEVQAIAECLRAVEALPSVNPQPKIGHCKDCKHFQKLPYHANKLGKCVQHWGFCPPSDWYCADFEPQKVKGEE